MFWSLFKNKKRPKQMVYERARKKHSNRHLESIVMKVLVHFFLLYNMLFRNTIWDFLQFFTLTFLEAIRCNLPWPVLTGSNRLQSLSFLHFTSGKLGSSGHVDWVWLGEIIMFVIINTALSSC